MLRKTAIIFRSFRMFWRFPLRSGLAVLSAVLGVSGALTSTNYALGGRAKVTAQLAKLGTNVLAVTPTDSKNTGGRARTGTLVTTLTPADYVALLREVPLFARSSAFSTRGLSLKAGDFAKKSCVVVGVEPDYFLIKQWAPREGAFFSIADTRRAARLVLLGSSVARDLFGESSPIAQRVLINRVPFEVAGVLTERGQSLDAANEDNQVYVPLTTAMHRLSNVEYFTGILFEVAQWQEMDRAATQTAALLRQRHRTLGKPPDFQIQNQKQLLDTQIAASSQLLVFVQWIGASALCVSGLGILAISWIGVRERTREIGTRRALGATHADIFVQIIWESISLSCLGCMLGILTAIQSSKFLAQWASQPEIFDRKNALVAIGLASAFNIAFGALPARTAALLDPIEALRFE